MNFLKQIEYSDFLTPTEFDPDEYARCVVSNRRFMEKDEENPFHCKNINSACDISASLKKLKAALEALELHISQMVADAHEDMLGAVSGLQDVGNGLEIAKVGLGNVKGILARLKSKISEPLGSLKQQETRLEHCLEATEMLKRISKVLSSNKRLQALQNNPQEAALIMADIASLFPHAKGDVFNTESDLTGIEVIDNVLPQLSNQRNQLQTTGDTFIHQGLEQTDTNLLSTGLLVWRNLGPAAWMDQKSDFAGKIMQIIDQTLQNHVTAPLSFAFKSLPTGTIDSETRDEVFEKLEAAFDSMHEAWKRMELLDRVLQRRKEPTGGSLSESSGKSWAEELSQSLQDQPLLVYFRNRFTTLLDSQLKQATKTSQPLLQTLQNFYPRLLRLCREFEARTGAIDLTNPLTPYNNGFLQRSATRVFDSLAACFPGDVKQTGFTALSGSATNAMQQLLSGMSGSTKQHDAYTLPARENILRFMRSLSGEMEAARFDAKLLQNVSKHISRAIMTICARIDGSIAWDILAVPTESIGVDGSPALSFMISMQMPQDVKQRGLVQPGSVFLPTVNTSPPPTPWLVCIDALVLLLVLEDGLWKLIDEVATMDAVTQALQVDLVPTMTEHVRPLIIKTASSLLSACTREVDATLQRRRIAWPLEVDVKLQWLSLHIFGKLNALGKDSIHMNEIQEWEHAVAARIIQLALRHCSLTKPWSDAVARRTNTDLDALETVVGSFLEKVGIRGGLLTVATDPGITDDYATTGALGRQLRFLRTYRPSILHDLDEFISDTKTIPPCLVLHHVMSISPIGTLVTPLERFNWTLGQYSDWIDSHTSDEHAKLLEQCLDFYVAEVNRRGLKEFCVEFVRCREVLGLGK